MQRPLPNNILYVLELLGRGFTLREISERLGVSYGALRSRLWRLRRAGYDIPYGRRGRPKKLRGEKIFRGAKMSRLLKNRGERGEKFIRLGRRELEVHIVSVVLSEGVVTTHEIKRRLRVWGYSFSDATFWRAVRKLELFNYIVVERVRGPQGHILRASPRLVFASRSPGGRDVFRVGYVEEYVENFRRRWEWGLEFGGLGLDHVRWLQVYGRRGWVRVEFHPHRGEEASFEKALGDLMRVAVLVAISKGLGFKDVVGMMAEEWVRLQSPLLRARGET